jgi:trehalose 2-sulfotransferase
MTAFRSQSYFICTSPRSGSTLLCALLKETGIAGCPGSHFHEPSLAQWLESYGLANKRFASREEALRGVFASARERGAGATKVFGLRMQRGSFPYFLEQVDRLYPGRTSDIERIEAAFGPTLFVHLQRADKLAQAVSRVMAEQTGLWHRASDGSELERLAPPREPSYDSEAIARHVADLAALDAEWEHWFAREGLAPLRISYDELARAPQETLAHLLDALGLDPVHARHIQPPTAKLADAISREWIERFAAETAA